MPSTPLHGPLTSSRFIQRYNRFLLQVRLEDTDEVVDVHMADPGRLKELLIPETRVWLRPADNPRRKTRWTAVLVEEGVGLFPDALGEAREAGVRILGRRCRVHLDRVELGAPVPAGVG